MKKLFALIMSMLMVACFMPTMAFADVAAPTAYGGGVLPQGPDMSGTVVNVNASNAQYTLDGAYGSINGKTINFTENIEGILHIGRPTKYAGSNTEYFVGGFTSAATNYQKFSTAEELTNFYNDNPYPSRCYSRTISNVTLTSNEGVTLAGFDMLDATGQVYQTRTDSYEWVQDRAIVDGSNDGYFGNINIDGLTFEGLNINNTSTEDIYAIQFDITSVLNKQNILRNITFKDCKISKACDSSIKNSGATHFMNNGGTADIYENITFDGCTIKVTGDATNRYGVFVLGTGNLKVNNCTLDGMTRAVQTQSGGPTGGEQNENGTLIVTNNLFKNIETYTVKVGGTQDITGLTIAGNSSENCAADCKVKIEPNGQYAGTGKVTICKNEWGNVGHETGYDWNKDMQVVAQIGDEYYETLQEAVEAAADNATIKLLSNVELASELVINKPITLDGNGKTITANGITNDHLIELTASATVKNVKLDSNNAATGINTYGQRKDLTFNFENVEMLNSAGTGITAKGGTVTLKDVKISGSAWQQSVDISPSNKQGDVQLQNGANLVVVGNTTLEDTLQVVFDRPGTDRVVGTITADGWNVTSEDKTFGEGDKAYTKTIFTLAKKSTSGGSYRETPLEKAKKEANTAISAAASANKYDEAEQAEVKKILDKAAADIKNAKTEEEVKAIKEAAQAEIDKVLTTEEKAQVASVGSVDKEIFKAKSKYSKLNGKKAIKVTWNVPNGMKFDGFEVFRSTKKYSGFGKTPYFTTTNTSYTNNKDLVAGKTYYYKVRGFVEINGERYYTGFSTKAFRTIK